MVYYKGMKNKTIKTIRLCELFGWSISTRQAAQFVLRKINEMHRKKRIKSVTISFARVRFISRSFADELLKIKERLEKRKEISTKFIYTNQIIQDTLKKVSKTQRKKPKRILKIHSLTASGVEKLEEIFQTI